ncbi:hypothetical protein ABTZ57_33870 [Streptomyces sp. NPDC094048]|uniref:hypothetical protein n=1 Tax=unclassified Streptomyces TaxID=2593676 RepID=UPI0033212DF1
MTAPAPSATAHDDALIQTPGGELPGARAAGLGDDRRVGGQVPGGDLLGAEVPGACRRPRPTRPRHAPPGR